MKGLNNAGSISTIGVTQELAHNHGAVGEAYNLGVGFSYCSTTRPCVLVASVVGE